MIFIPVPLAPVALVPVGLLVVEVPAVPVEFVVAAPVEPGSPRLLIGLVATPLKPGRWSSSSDLACARAPSGRARLLGLALAPCRRFPVWNLDQA